MKHDNVIAEVHPKVWGEEIWLANNEYYCSKIFHMRPRYCSSLHCHKEKDETFYVLDGDVYLEVEVSPGNYRGYRLTSIDSGGIRIYPNTYHRFLVLEPSRVIEVSTQHSEEDVYRKTTSMEIGLTDFQEIFSTIHSQDSYDGKISKLPYG